MQVPPLSRPRHRGAAGLLVLLVTAVVATPAAPAASGANAARVPDRPNILFVLTDDMTRADLHSMPGVQRVVGDHGVRFSRAMVNVSLCCPSRTTILRGQYAHDTGVLTNGGTNGGFEAAYRFGVERSTIATWLHARGYRTGLVGKYLNGFPNTAPPTYRPPGWTDWVTPVGGNPYNEYGYTLDVNGRLERHGFAPADYGTRVYLRYARQFITAAHRAHRPFFLDLALYPPHRPATPDPRDDQALSAVALPRSPSFNELDVRDKPRWLQAIPRMRPPVIARSQALFQRRRESLRAVDRGVVGLVHLLRATHQLRDTYVVFMSDNGFHLGQHRLPAGKETAFEEDIRVPLLVRGPGIPAGSATGALVGNVDLAPTFARLAGARVPRFVDGRSLTPLLHDPTADFGRREFLLEHWEEIGRTARPNTLPAEPPDRDQTDTPLRRPRRSDRRGRFHGPRPHGVVDGDQIPEYQGFRTDTYTYVEYVDGERELYDLRADPFELHNAIGAVTRPTRVALQRRLADLDQCSGRECRHADAAPVVPLRYRKGRNPAPGTRRDAAAPAR